MNVTCFAIPITASVRCECCHRIMVKGSRRTVLDDNGTLAISTWQCSSCDAVTEEIRILSQDRAVRPHRTRYIVRPQH